VARRASGRYKPEATTWLKIKNRNYTQAKGRWISSIAAALVFQRLPDSARDLLGQVRGRDDIAGLVGVSRGPCLTEAPQSNMQGFR
jgi:hypothetical protein